jgi:hypothetical protein
MRSQIVATCVLAIIALSFPVSAQVENKRLYVEPAEGFEVFISAAIAKKKVAIDVVTDVEKADYVMKTSAIEVEKVGTGAKWVNCLFAYCAGNSDKGNTSVQVIDKEGVVRWSYAVNKGRGAKNKQSMAEAIAKHFKSEFLRQR